MSGPVSGVAKRWQDIENRAIYIHCFGHLVNLAASDSIKQIKILKEALANAYEIIKLIVKSPKREATFKKLKREFGDQTAGVKSLCPTRWTVRPNLFWQSLKTIHFC